MTLYDQLMEAARSCDQMPSPPEFVYDPHSSTSNGNGNGAEGERPGDIYNLRATWAEVLEPHGWVFVYRRGELDHWRRPGKAIGVSATTGIRSNCGKDLLHIFTTSAAPLDPGRSYNKFAAYALLNHEGDCGAAARALRAKGYVPDDPFEGVRVKTGGGKASPVPFPNQDTSSDPLDQDATAHDLILANSVIRWAWEKWLPVGVLTILASEPGVGKTRFCCDLAKRIYRGLPWPDGSPMTLPAKSLTLWVPADNQHPELGSIPGDFGFPPTALFLNATKRNPFGGTMLDEKAELKDFEARIARVKPVIVFIDTTLNATDRTSHKPEDAKAFFKPLQEIAARQQIVLVCVTHLNTAGKPLGRRIEGQGRIVLMLEKPDPDQEHRRKLWVKKTNSLLPAPLGVTMGNDGNEYDTSPPEAPADDEDDIRPRKKSQGASFKMCQWLLEQLRVAPRRVSELRDEAETAGFSTTTLYAARKELKLEQFESQNRQWWRLPSEDDE